MKLRPSTAMKRGRRRTLGARAEDWKRPITVADPLRLNPELYRRIRNWAMWRSGGLSIGMAAAYQSLGSVFRGGDQLSLEEGPKPVPVLTAEAEEFERAVRALPHAWFTVMVVWWCKGGSIKSKASMCGCRKEAMLERIELAHRSLERTFS